MRTILFRALAELNAHRSVVLVTIVAEQGSAPRGPGSQMLVGVNGQLTGTIGGGQVERQSELLALSLLKEPCIVELWSDSKYVIDGLSKGWAKGWKAKGWVKSDKKPALNPDLWDELLRLESIHTLRYHWVKGHAENEFNNRCDELAVEESHKFR